ncbi:hypothetical protein V8C42DRAFT_327131 [Trichoderma barbatum]
MSKPHSVEGHTYTISVSAHGRVYLDKLSTHDNMVGLVQAVNDALLSETDGQKKKPAPVWSGDRSRRARVALS